MHRQSSSQLPKRGADADTGAGLVFRRSGHDQKRAGKEVAIGRIRDIDPDPGVQPDVKSAVAGANGVARQAEGLSRAQRLLDLRLGLPDPHRPDALSDDDDSGLHRSCRSARRRAVEPRATTSTAGATGRAEPKRQPCDNRGRQHDAKGNEHPPLPRPAFGLCDQRIKVERQPRGVRRHSASIASTRHHVKLLRVSRAARLPPGRPGCCRSGRCCGERRGVGGSCGARAGRRGAAPPAGGGSGR